MISKERCMDSRIGKRRDELLGKEFETNACGKCFIDYKGSRDVLVMFYDPIFIKTCNLSNLVAGRVQNPMFPSFYGRGFIGSGRYDYIRDKEAYYLWTRLLARAYNINYHDKFPTYKDVEVCKEWYNFQNFAEWCYSQKFFNTKDDKGKSYQLDKDILAKGNRVYSPETCCFVPSEVNNLLLSSRANRGNLPVGVTLFKRDNNYTARMSVSGRCKQLGYFNKVEDAFNCYKQAKECHIKSLAEKWKGKIDDKAYEALINWEIGVDD